MFRGDFQVSLDLKGRMAVPSRYRERILEECGGSLMVTVSVTHRCLTVYPSTEWQRIEDEIQSLPTFDRQAQALRHLLIGHAHESEMDGHGRILLSSQLREWAGLDRKVRVVGQVRKFELWDEAAWGARIEELHGPSGALLSEPSEALRSIVL